MPGKRLELKPQQLRSDTANSAAAIDARLIEVADIGAATADAEEVRAAATGLRSTPEDPGAVQAKRSI